MLTDAHLKAVIEVDRIADGLQEQGFYLPEAYKRRDPREPGRTMKEAYEDKVGAVMRKYMRGQQRRLRELVEHQFPARKQGFIEETLSDEVLEAVLLTIFISMAQDSIELIAESFDIPFIPFDFNALATEVATEAVGTLITNINDTTLASVQEAIASFAQEPGMTISELMDTLPFGEVRSQLIAITEVTNLFASMELRMGQELQALYPGVTVVHQWFTNNDPNVCPICVGLDGKTTSPGEPFTSDYDGQEYFRPGEPHPRDRCWISTRTVI